MLAVLYWFSVIVVIYVYFGYPVAVFLLSLVLNRKVAKNQYEPMVTILIAAYNEAEHIQKTIQNKLDLNYKADKLEIIVISDGSTDQTDDLVKEFNSENIRLIRQGQRAGKTAALNVAVPLAKGDIIVFSDANSIYDAFALKKLITNFSDEKVGYVTGKMVYVKPDGSLVGDGCSAYMKYENLLRTFETKTGSIVGVDGGIDAVRKSLYEPMRKDQLPDLVLPLTVAEKGYRVVYEPSALLKEDSLKEVSDEYMMRVRVSLRAIWALFDKRSLLLFKKNNIFFSWKLWSHKVLRYICFIFIGLMYFLLIPLFPLGGIYLIMFVAQTIAIILSLLPLFVTYKGLIGKILNLFNYFALLNVASAHAFIKFCLGRKQAIWTPRKG